MNDFRTYAALFIAALGAFLLILNRLMDGKLLPEATRTPSAPREPLPPVSPEREQELLMGVCPEVRAILQDELRAGNWICGGGEGGDWPWPDSTILTLAKIFQSEPRPLLPPLGFQGYNIKTGDGDSIFCPEHHILVFAAMPTLEQHLAPEVLVGQKRKERLEQLQR